jgi:hypothetical protein
VCEATCNLHHQASLKVESIGSEDRRPASHGVLSNRTPRATRFSKHLLDGPYMWNPSSATVVEYHVLYLVYKHSLESRSRSPNLRRLVQIQIYPRNYRYSLLRRARNQSCKSLRVELYYGRNPTAEKFGNCILENELG